MQLSLHSLVDAARIKADGRGICVSCGMRLRRSSLDIDPNARRSLNKEEVSIALDRRL